MNIEGYGAVLVGESQTPCFIIDINTDEIVYKNKRMDILLANTNAKNIIGQKFYNVICNQNQEGGQAYKKDVLMETHIFNCHIYDDVLKLNLHATFCKIEFQHNIYVLCKYSSLDATANDTMPYEEAMTRCMLILKKPSAQMPELFMELLCNYYQSNCSFIYLIDQQKSQVDCSSQWHTKPEYAVSQNPSNEIEIKDILSWLEMRNEMNIIEESVTSFGLNNNSYGAKVLEIFKHKNILLSVMIDNKTKEPIGVVGMVDRKSEFFDYRLINAITRFVSHDLDNDDLSGSVDDIRHKDFLTNLYNHVAYSKKIEELLISNHNSLGVISVDINGLKRVNSDFGYAHGDMCLKRVADIVKNHFEIDFYRISGDEFIGLMPDVSKDFFEEKVSLLHNQMKSQGDYDYSFGHAWGYGQFNVAKLAHDANVIMHINKQEYYSVMGKASSHANDNTLSNLLKYISNEEFLVYLQPQVDLKTSEVIGAEALIRRFDKENEKMVFPDQFIPMYETKSIIRHVDLFVIDRVCKLLKKWEKTNTELPISVNLSRVTLQEHGIVDTISEICEEYNINNKNLVIEVTERVGLVDNNVESSLVSKFRNKGFTISLDDFGCAYSNIVTLAQIDVDEVKIDKSLVDELLHNEKTHIIVGNVLNMCNSFRNTHTLAEGIEEQLQVEMLLEYGCKYGQGYFYSKPIPIDEFCEKYINNTNKD